MKDHEVVAIDIQLHATTSIEDLLRLLKGMAGVKAFQLANLCGSVARLTVSLKFTPDNQYADGVPAH